MSPVLYSIYAVRALLRASAKTNELAVQLVEENWLGFDDAGDARSLARVRILEEVQKPQPNFILVAAWALLFVSEDEGEALDAELGATAADEAKSL